MLCYDVYIENINICTLKICVYYNLQVKVTQVSERDCQPWFHRPITEKRICVHDFDKPIGDRGRSCRGDSGGPMMCGYCGHNVLAGISSFGGRNCNAYWPNVYTRVSEYRDWIKEHTGF